MSRQYFDNSHEMSHGHVNMLSGQSSNSSHRRNIPSTSRDVAIQSSFQPNRERIAPLYHHHHHHHHHHRDGEYSYSNDYQQPTTSSSNRMKISSNGGSHRRYRLETPSNNSHGRSYRSYNDDDHHQHRFHPLHREHAKNEQPTASRPPAFQSVPDDPDSRRQERDSDENNRRYHQNDNHPLNSNHQSVAIPSAYQCVNAIQSLDHSTSSSGTIPTISRHAHRPASRLTNFIETFFDGLSASINDNDYPHLAPIDLVAFAWMIQRPDMLSLPAALHTQLGDLSGLLNHNDTPSVGLSDNDIERIPTIIYRKSSKSKSSDDKCVICLSEFKIGESVKRLHCRHFFHPECIDPWLKTSTQCPICRQKQPV